MKIPRHILIKGTKYKIKKNFDFKDKEMLGLCDKQNKIIYLSKHQTDKELRNTFIHELLHALLQETALDASLDQLEEPLCYAISEFIDQILLEL